MSHPADPPWSTLSEVLQQDPAAQERLWGIEEPAAFAAALVAFAADHGIALDVSAVLERLHAARRRALETLQWQ